MAALVTVSLCRLRPSALIHESMTSDHCFAGGWLSPAAARPSVPCSGSLVYGSCVAKQQGEPACESIRWAVSRQAT